MFFHSCWSLGFHPCRRWVLGREVAMCTCRDLDASEVEVLDAVQDGARADVNGRPRGFWPRGSLKSGRGEARWSVDPRRTMIGQGFGREFW